MEEIIDRRTFDKIKGLNETMKQTGVLVEKTEPTDNKAQPAAQNARLEALNAARRPAMRKVSKRDLIAE